MKKYVFTGIIALIIFPLSSTVFAESVYDINIPSGAADKNAPFHWQSEKDGDTSGFIEIVVNDSINWKNGDTVTHTITSGIPPTPDGIFDSGNVDPGELFTFQFTEIGEFPYYCTIHPWRTGVVSVVSGHSILPDVGIDVGDGMTVFDVEYKFNRIVDNAGVDEDTKSISFELKGNTNSEDNTLTLFLPSSLISGIYSVTVDDYKTENFSQSFEEEIIILTINDLPATAKTITVSGATVVPEFAELVFTILIVSLVGTIIATKRKSMMTIRSLNSN